jgi:glutamate synthase (ferredoxin)
MTDRLTSASSLRGTLWTGRERDACGTGFVARRDGVADRRVVDLALDAVERIAHRGAVDAGDAGGEPTGDGAGILLQVPWSILADALPECARIDASRRAAGMLFLPIEPAQRDAARVLVERAASELGTAVVGWRVVPVEPTALGAAARATLPAVEQVVVAVPSSLDPASVDAYLYRLRKQAERAARDAGLDLYVASLSARTMVYKALVVGTQLRRFFPDLMRADLRSSIAVFHQRYSTNTFPTWRRVQPCRTIAHNGEINTLHGNASWMRARALDLGWQPGTGGEGDDGSWLTPVIDVDGSDSSMLDDAVQLLQHGGRPLDEALTMLVPPAWDHEQDLPADHRDVLRVLSSACEPWDGPAAVAYSDGVTVGACLDRNGLRPARWLETDDGIIACASETGAVPVDPRSILRSGRLGPGQALVLDTATGILRSGDEVLSGLADREPWGVLAAAQQADVADAHEPGELAPHAMTLLPLHALHGYSREELTAVIRPMVQLGSPPVGSMGDDTPIAPLSDQPRSLFSYLRQGFAEVTNPAIDPLRERASMSLDTLVGPRPRLLDRRADGDVALRLRSPVLSDAGMDALRDVASSRAVTVQHLDTSVDRTGGPVAEAEVARCVEQLCRDAEAAVHAGSSVLVLSDRAATPDRPPLPALLVASAVHQHLLDAGLRTRVGIVQESGEVREPHHLAALLGHGVDAVCPWLALATAHDLTTGVRPKVDVDGTVAQSRLVAALEYGLLTAMSRMGISTLSGYRGAQVFEAIGLDEALGHHLRGTLRRPGRIGLGWVAARVEAQADHAARLSAADADGTPPLPSPGFYKFKRDGEQHGFAPAVVAALHHALNVDDVLGAGFAEARERWRGYVDTVRGRPPIDLRDLLVVAPGESMAPVPLDEVQPASELVRRFSTGAMSHGSIAAEAHETITLGAHLVGAWSNSGEGGEAVERFGTTRGSDIRQVASGRFGVTPAYLRSARELQVKIAQGSKPGEGGHLPGHKVTEEIARIRHTQPGVSLISPPPHHDIYSIEDLAQLLHDLACVAPDARSSVKLVSQGGVGTIAAGVVKARADVIVVSGANGGTGASPLGSIKHAGMPWEWGLAETQQVLVANRLRGRVRLRVDGGMRTARDVLVAALLGADEFSFGTAVLVAEGCTMARTCHNDKCPVGIATQRADLRALFSGRPDQVGAFLLLVAEELRELLAELGARSLDELVGRVDLLRAPSGEGAVVDLGALLAEPDVPASWPRRHVGERNDVYLLEDGLDARLARELWPLLDAAEPGEVVRLDVAIDNAARTVGARVSGDIAERIGPAGLDDVRAHVRFDGSAGQSFGAFGIRGLRLELVGEANDFVGKGLAGAQLDVRFPDGSRRAGAPRANVLLGNACLYGATSGVLLAAGTAGERFAVRNSGADAVVEGTGDHLCEYMTGGTVVVLGDVGRNVASGMSGGRLWVLAHGSDLLDERLAATASIVEPDDEAVEQLLGLLRLHVTRTGSAIARELLADPAGITSRMRCIAAADRSAGAAAPAVAAHAAR